MAIRGIPGTPGSQGNGSRWRKTCAHRQPREERGCRNAGAAAPAARRRPRDRRADRPRIGRLVDRHARHRRVARQQRRELRELVLAGAAREPRREVVGDSPAGTARRNPRSPRLGDDARRVDDAVDAAAPLDIPRDELHQRMPARMKLCTNCRWNSRKRDQQRRRRHERRRADDRPVDALVGRREDLQARRSAGATRPSW